MTENLGPVAAARKAIRDAGRPLTAREAVLIAATAHAATRDPADPKHDKPTERVADVITDLRDAATEAVITSDPGPAVRAIRRLLTHLGVGTPIHDPAPTRRKRPAPAATPHPSEAAADPEAYREAVGA